MLRFSVAVSKVFGEIGTLHEIMDDSRGLLGCSIKFQGYRCFSDKDFQGLDRIKPINIVVGRNNSGKSTLVDCFVSLSLDDRGKLANIGKIEIERRLPKKVVEEALKHLGTFEMHYGNQTKRFNILACQTLMFDQIAVFYSAKGTISFNRLKTNSDENQETLRLHQHLGGHICSGTSNLMTGWKCFRINAERDVVPEEACSKDLEANGRGLTAAFQSLMTRSENNMLDLLELELIPALNQILEPDNLYTRILAFESGGKWELYLEEKGKGRIPLSATGSGIKTILHVLANLIVIPRAGDVLDLSKTIYAFEELENNLHPATLRRLFLFIRKFCEKHNCTFFITTHSHLVIDMFADDDLAQIIHVKHDGKRTTVSTLDKSNAGSVFEDLDVRASDLLQTNVVVWVEGPTDAMYFECWMDLHSNHSIRRGIDYQCVFYGGSCGTHMAFDDQTTDKLIEAWKVCRNFIFMADSNKSKKSSQVDKNTKRLSEEANKSCFGWLTKGREIENYLPTALVLSEAGVAFPIDEYTDIYEATRAARKTKNEMNKVAFAHKILPQLSKENMYILDLSDQLDRCMSLIRKWNAKTESH
jgi:putative ATP-dependent endonuclease of the OLD family